MIEIHDPEEVRAELRRACDAAETHSAWAAAAGVSRSYISHLLRGDLDPGPAIVNKLGFELRLVYVRMPRRSKKLL